MSKKTINHETLADERDKYKRNAKIALQLAKKQESEKIKSKQFIYVTSPDGKTKTLKKL